MARQPHGDDKPLDPAFDVNPGDEAPAGVPGTGEDLCRRCAGSGRLDSGAPCPECGGTGRVNVGIGGA
jgi:RecJ-like exonuclease